MRLTTTIGLTLYLVGANAAIVTVSNDPDRPAMYDNIQQAYDSCTVDGDTLQIFSSTEGYGNLTISKRLYVQGNGFDVDQSNLNSKFGIVTLNTNSNGTILEGVWIARLDVFGAGTIRNCYVGGTYASVWSLIGIGTAGQLTAINNVLIRDEVGQSTGFATIDGHQNNTLGQLFHNNVIMFNNHNSGGNNCIRWTKNSHFQNNVFLSWDTTEGNLMPNGVGNADNVFINNITYSVLNVSSDCDYCSLAHNVVSKCVDCDLVTGNQNGSNNLIDTAVFNGGYTDGPWSIDSDLQLVPGTPGYGAGIDGTDVGVFGGSYPMIPGSYHNQVLKRVPYVDSFVVANPVVLLDCPIHFTSGAHMLHFSGMAEQEIVAAEVYFDADPGPGSGIPLAVDSGISTTHEACLDTTLSLGSHRMCIRFKADSGLWSSPRSSAIEVLNLPCSVAPCALWDCPEQSADFGDPCDDGNPESIDTIDSSCVCVGFCPDLAATIGDTCDDGDPDTETVINSSCTCVITNTGLNGITNPLPNLTILPNPAKHQVRLNWRDGTLRSPVIVVVLDAIGQLVASRTDILRNNLELDIAHLAPGTYFVRLQGDQWQAHGRFIKQ